MPGGGFSGLNGRAPSPPESTVVYTDDEEGDYFEPDRCACVEQQPKASLARLLPMTSASAIVTDTV